MDEKLTNEESNNLNLWMIRPCEIYNDEYNECTSILSRFHQRFIYGSTIDCNNWHGDYLNCLKWKKDNDLQAAKSLVQSETIRRNNRLKTFYANNVWEIRKSPPENWNEPLPEYIAQRQSNSTFKKTLNEINLEADKSFCSIM